VFAGCACQHSDTQVLSSDTVSVYGETAGPLFHAWQIIITMIEVAALVTRAPSLATLSITMMPRSRSSRLPLFFSMPSNILSQQVERKT